MTQRPETASLPDWTRSVAEQRQAWLDSERPKTRASIETPSGVNIEIIKFQIRQFKSLLGSSTEINQEEVFLNAHSWPSLTQYIETIATPSNCFLNSNLKSAIPSTNKLGLPLSWAGQFALVFQLKRNSVRFVVRCFSSRISDQQERYAALHNALEKAGEPDCFAGFEFINKGILVAGDWYPIISMDWVEGQTLDEEVGQAVATGDKARLEKLAKTWRALISNLSRLQIAHGDLQHENILVHHEKMRLVDYDGAYVPALKGRKANEFGLSHYQHPLRSGDDFNEMIDHFSGLVIYLSLLALSNDPTLWKSYHTDKHLLFKDKDYQDPAHSSLFQKLANSPDSTLKLLATRLRKACGEPIFNLPALETVLVNSQPAGPREKTTKAPSWVIDLQNAQTIPKTNKPVQPRSETSPLPDYLKNLKN